MTFEQWLQSRLTAHGYPVGEIDGRIGGATISALKAFQAARGMSQTGKADDVTVAKLRETSSAISSSVRVEIPDRDEEAPEPVKPPKIIWPRQNECMAFYGAVGTNQTQIDIPFDMYLAWQKGTRISRMTLHKKVAESAKRVLENIAHTYSAAERKSLGIDLFGGSLNVRKMRGGTAYSMHSWGIAIDFDPERNGLHVHKPMARLSHSDAVPFWQHWEIEGWLSLGRARDFDWMHIQAARL